MPAKIPLNTIKQWFIERGSELIGEFVSASKRLSYRCVKCQSTTSHTNFSSLKANNPECICWPCREKVALETQIKYTEDKVQEILKTDFGVELVKYTASNQPFTIKCKNCGEDYEFCSFISFKSSQALNKCLCKKCRFRKVGDGHIAEKLEDVKKYFQEHNSTLLSEYTGYKSRLLFTCGKCGKEVKYTKFNRLKVQNPDCLCLKCHRKPRPKKAKILKGDSQIPFTKNLFEKFLLENGSKLIHFTKSTEPKTYSCVKCGVDITTPVSVSVIIQKKRILCYDCLDKKFIPVEEVQKFFTQAGSELLGNYINTTSPVLFRCSKCKKEAAYTSFSQLKTKNPLCKCIECNRDDTIRGENHPGYNPNLTEEDRLKERNLFMPYGTWQRDVLALKNYKSVISGLGGNLAIHHLFSWAEYKDLRPFIWNGVTLTKEEHKKFHSLFGYGKNTFEQFRQFVCQEKSGSNFYLFENSNTIIDVISEPTSTLFSLKKEFYKKGINYLPIFDFELISKPEIINSQLLIKSPLGGKIVKIGARNLILRKINSTESEAFFSVNHRQRHVPAKVTYALCSPDTGEVLSAMSFSKPRFAKEFTFELLRFCSKLLHVIPGAANRLFQAFLKDYPNEKIISYCDIRFSSLNHEETVYPKLGFKYSHQSQPNYVYVKDGKVHSRLEFQKHKLSELLPIFDPLKTESENMKVNGYLQFFDCGNHVFIYE